MNQAFPQSGFSLRTHIIKTATTTKLLTVLNVAGQPPAVGVVGVFAAAHDCGLFYDEDSPSDTHYVQNSNALATAVTQNAPFPFVWPMQMTDSAGTVRDLKVLTSGTGPTTVIYLVNSNAAVV